MGRGHRQAAVGGTTGQSEAAVVERRAPRRHLKPVRPEPSSPTARWDQLAATDAIAFATAVARKYGPQLTESLKAATPINKRSGERWFDRFDVVRLNQPRAFASSPIVITLAAYRRRRVSGELKHAYGAGYRLDPGALLQWVKATEAGQPADLPTAQPFPSFIPFVEP